MKTSIHFLIILLWVLLRMISIQTKVVQEIKTHALWSMNYFSENRAVYYITWNNIQYSEAGHKWQYGACALYAGYLSLHTHTHTHTHTHSHYIILIAFPLQQWLHERAWMLRCTYTLPVFCVLSFGFLGNYAASEFYMPTFRNTLSHFHRQIDVSRMKLR